MPSPCRASRRRARWSGGDDRIRTGDGGFADRCVRPLRHVAERCVLAAPRGFEPRFTDPKSGVLPLDEGATAAPKSTRWEGGSGAEDGTRTRDPHLGKVMLYQLSYFRAFLKLPALRCFGAESQNRTGDTAIFSRVLYQLSYLGPPLRSAYSATSSLVAKPYPRAGPTPRFTVLHLMRPNLPCEGRGNHSTRGKSRTVREGWTSPASPVSSPRRPSGES